MSDSLITEAREAEDWPRFPAKKTAALIYRLRKDLESTAAELRQERERADEAEARDPSIIALGQYRENLRLEVERVAKEYTRANQAEAELARAREVIEKALDFPADRVRYDGGTLGSRMRKILATYEQEKKQ